MMRRWTSRWSGPSIALVVAIVAVIALATAYGYSRSSGLFPIFTGWIFVGLALLEFGLRLRDSMRADTGLPEDPTTGLEAADSSTLLDDLSGFGWVGLFLLAIYLAGFLVATPLFMFAFLRLRAGRGTVYAGTAAIVTVALVYGVFVALLEYRLFAGIAFGA